MKETLLLLLLTLGSGDAAPSASPGLAPPPGVAAPVTGVWRGTWLAPRSARAAVPIDAVLAPGTGTGSLIAVIIAGAGRERRTARLSGRYETDGVRLVLPSGGALRLSVDGGSRLVGEVKGGGPGGFVPGDGALELSRVRR